MNLSTFSDRFYWHGCKSKSKQPGSFFLKTSLNFTRARLSSADSDETLFYSVTYVN